MSVSKRLSRRLLDISNVWADSIEVGDDWLLVAARVQPKVRLAKPRRA